MLSLDTLKMAPYSFLIMRKLVSKSHDDVSLQKKKLWAASTSSRVTHTGRILAAVIAHFQCASHP